MHGVRWASTFPLCLAPHRVCLHSSFIWTGVADQSWHVWPHTSLSARSGCHRKHRPGWIRSTCCCCISLNWLQAIGPTCDLLLLISLVWIILGSRASWPKGAVPSGRQTNRHIKKVKAVLSSLNRESAKRTMPIWICVQANFRTCRAALRKLIPLPSHKRTKERRKWLSLDPCCILSYFMDIFNSFC